MIQFTIHERHISDADLGAYTIWDIEAVDGENNQYMTVYSAQELAALGSTISSFISNNKTFPTMKQPSENELRETSPFADIIKGYLQPEFRPVTDIDPEAVCTYRVMTSQEILLDLADMVELSINEVAESMTLLGYHTAKIDGKVGWLMEYTR